MKILPTLTALAVLLLPSLGLADTNAIRCVQNELTALGFDAGGADGKLGGGTKKASRAYQSHMKSKYSGWNMPDLTSKNAVFWCKQVASGNPAVKPQYEAYLAAINASALSVTKISVAKNIKAKEPYLVEIDYEVLGAAPIRITGACFTWSGEGPYCFPAQLDKEKRRVQIMLTTGRAATYQLNGAIQYVSGGKKATSNWYSNTIMVSR